MEIIYCAAGNPRFAQIAIDAGMKYGAQLPNKIYHSPYFVDQNWQTPNRKRYMTALAEHRPHIATVLDLEREEQLSEVLDWAHEAAEYAKVIVIIPKCSVIDQIPRCINNKEIRLGYSVPTTFAGTGLPIWDFVTWPVHLLGGNPQNQLTLARYLNVRSADGNAAQKASMWGQVWRNGKWQRGHAHERDFIYEVFAESCQNILSAWRLLTQA